MIGCRVLMLGWVLAALLGACSSRPPFEVGPIELVTVDGPAKGWWAKVDLSNRDVEIIVTGPLDAGVLAKDPARTESHLTSVPAWAEAVGATLGVNANFFSKVIQRGPGERDPGWVKDLPVDLIGLSVSDGRVVSPPNVVKGVGDPAIIGLDGRARVGYIGPGDLEGVRWGVAGIGPSPDDKTPGTLIAVGGKNTGATARPGPTVRHPRTAAGVSSDGRMLILAVVDGRQPGYSVGMTLIELGDLVISLGASDALNLDGGGSSSFVYYDLDGRVVTNKPSDGGKWRPVGNQLGVRVRGGRGRRYDVP